MDQDAYQIPKETAADVAATATVERHARTPAPSIGDRRTASARRFRDLIVVHTGELGHEPSEAESSIIRRASALEVQLEQLEAAWARHPPSTADLEAFSRLSNTLRRHLSVIGLGRKKPAQQSVLDRYLTSNGQLP